MPVSGADTCLDAAWLGWPWLVGPAAAGTDLQSGRDGLTGLPLESLLEQFAAQVVAELDDQLFHVVKGSAPGRPVGPIEVVEQVFGSSL